LPAGYRLKSNTSDNTAYPVRTFPKVHAQIFVSLFFFINQGGETKTSDDADTLDEINLSYFFRKYFNQKLYGIN